MQTFRGSNLPTSYTNSVKVCVYILFHVSRYDIGVHRVGLVPFSNDVYLSQVFDLGSSVSKDAVLTAVNSLTQDDIGLG